MKEDWLEPTAQRMTLADEPSGGVHDPPAAVGGVPGVHEAARLALGTHACGAHSGVGRTGRCGCERRANRGFRWGRKRDDYWELPTTKVARLENNSRAGGVARNGSKRAIRGVFCEQFCARSRFESRQSNVATNVAVRTINSPRHRAHGERKVSNSCQVFC